MGSRRASRKQVHGRRIARLWPHVVFLIALLLALGESTLMRADPAGNSLFARAIHISHGFGSASAHAADMHQHHGGGHYQASHAHGGAESHSMADVAGDACPACMENAGRAAHAGALCCPLACAGLAAQPGPLLVPAAAPCAPASAGPSSSEAGRTLEPPTPPPRRA